MRGEVEQLVESVAKGNNERQLLAMRRLANYRFVVFLILDIVVDGVVSLDEALAVAGV